MIFDFITIKLSLKYMYTYLQMHIILCDLIAAFRREQLQNYSKLCKIQ